MHLRELNVGCFGGGTGLPSLLGGLKNNPWIHADAVVTMFDTGGNLLLSMMQRYSGDFLDAIDGLRALLGCRGRVWPVSVQQASVCAEYGDGSLTRGEVEVDAGQTSGRFVRRIWLEPPVAIHPAVAKAIGEFDAVTIG